MPADQHYAVVFSGGDPERELPQPTGPLSGVVEKTDRQLLNLVLASGDAAGTASWGPSGITQCLVAKQSFGVSDFAITAERAVCELLTQKQSQWPAFPRLDTWAVVVPSAGWFGTHAEGFDSEPDPVQISLGFLGPIFSGWRRRRRRELERAIEALETGSGSVPEDFVWMLNLDQVELAEAAAAAATLIDSVQREAAWENFVAKRMREYSAGIRTLRGGVGTAEPDSDLLIYDDGQGRDWRDLLTTQEILPRRRRP